MVLTDFLKEEANSSGKGIVFVGGSTDEFISYGELYATALTTLYELQQRGLKPGDELILQLGNNKHFLVVFWACLLGGIIAIPLSPATQQEYRRKLLTIANMIPGAMLLCDEDNFGRVSEYCTAHRLDQGDLLKRRILFSELTNVNTPGKMEERQPDDIAYVQFSSGSTGDAKGVMLTHANLVSNVLDIKKRSQIHAADIMLSWMPLTHDMGLICFHLTSLVSGATQLVMPTELFIRRPVLWMEKAGRYKASILYSPNFGYHYFLSAFKQEVNYDWDLSAIRLIYNGAEQISADLCHRFLETLQPYQLNARCMFPGYGLAEASVAVTLPEPGAPIVSYVLERSSLNVLDEIRFDETGNGVKLVALGTVLDQCRIRICDHTNEELPANRVGHVQIKGQNVTQGYYRNANATNAAITSDGWLQTGDIGFIRNNQLVITGRWKDLIIINGQNYFPSDIEFIAQELAGAGKVAACGISNGEAAQEQLVIFLVHKGNIKEFAELAAAVKREVFLQTGLVARDIVPVNRLPRTTSGKLQRFQLVRQYREGLFDKQLLQLSAVAIQPDDNIEQQVCQLCKELTGASHIGSHDNFFELGISSVQAIHLLAYINEVYNTSLTVKDFFDNHTISRLSAFIQAKTNAGPEALPVFEKVEVISPSYIQQRFWKIEQLRQGASPLNIFMAYRIRGPLNVTALQVVLRALVMRHESLRTVFHWRDGQLFQQSHEKVQPAQFIGGEVLPGDFIQQYINRPFDLASGPLYRFLIIERTQHEYDFLVVIHHLVADGWSMSVIAKEISEDYTALTQGKNIQRPPLNRSAASCLYWRQKSLTANEIEKSRLYWMQVLDNCPSTLKNLHARPAEIFNQAAKGKKQTLQFSPELTTAIAQSSVDNRVTTFTSLLTVSLVALNKITREQDIVIGTDAAGRDRKKFVDQVGCFIQTLPLRFFIKEEDNLRSILQQVKDRLLEGMRQTAFSYEQLLNEGTGLFNVLILFHNFDTGMRFSGTAVEQLHIDSGTCICDLQLEFIERNGTLTLEIIYNTALFREEEINRISSVLQNIITKVTSSPDKPLSHIDILGEDEKQRILTKFNSPAVLYPDGETFVSLLEKQAFHRPDNIALIDGQTRYTYRQLNELANQLARYFILQFNVCEKDYVALLSDRSANAVIAIIAILKTGAAYVPVDAEFPRCRVTQILDSCNAKLVLVPGEADNSAVERQVAIIDYALLHGGLDSYDRNNLQRIVSGSHIAYLIYTSGTEGIPKGVMIRHSSLYDYLQTFTRYFQISDADTVVQQASLSFDTAAEEIFPVLAAGGKLVIHRQGGRDIEGLLRAVQDNGVTVLSTTPMVLNEINKQSYRIKQLRVVISGGDRLRMSHIDQLLNHVPVYNTYGPTEATICSTYYKVSVGDSDIPIGKPISNRQVYILDDAGRIVPIGCVGEICIAGAGLAQGYLGDEALTARKFSVELDTSIYRTGDLGRWLADGNIEFIGRKDSQVKINGYRIELKEIEDVLLKHPDIGDVLLVQSSQQALIAYCRCSFHLHEADVRAYLRNYLPAYMIPANFFFLQEFPRTLNGKIDRKALPVHITEARQIQLPASILEMQLLEVWKTVFGKNAISVDDGFYDIGGTSIIAFQLSSIIQQKLGIQIPLQYLVSGMTIREIVSMPFDTKNETGRRIEKAPEAVLYPVSHAQKRLWILNEIDDNAHSNNLHWSYLLEGDVDIDVLQKAFDILMARHESLRTGFCMEGGRLMQRINEPSASIVKYQDLRMLPDPLHQAVLISKNEALAPMQPGEGSMFKVSLLHIAERRLVLIVTIHHIAADGLSVNNLVKELKQLYTAGIGGKPMLLPPLTVQYKDFSYWETRMLQTEHAQDYCSFWKATYKADMPVATIPYDYEKKTTRNYDNYSMQFPLDAALSASVSEFCSRQRVSQVMLLSTALYCLLYRYNGSKSMITGVMVNGRWSQDLENQVGFFVNTLPLHAQITGAESFSDLLHRVKTAIVDLLDYQYFPYDHLCAEVADGKGLFNVIVSSEIDGENEIHNMPGMTVKEFQPKSQWRNDVDMTLGIENKTGVAALSMLADAELYKPATCEKVAGHLISIISGVINNPGMLIRDMEMADEQKDWNQFSAGELENMLHPFLTQKS